MALIDSTLGQIPDTDTTRKIYEAENRADVLVIACEWYYCGTDPRFTAHVGTMVRRDVWANVKCGLSTKVEKGL